ncbi:MAG: AbrB/MazE/SpoVT family DNA-binding domain-containing protein [Thaumarchaeota archaeon]|nr:AbrB/MazE/SpoVT family DNA-binding domain-containing protein [Nitrososphaerota archaeon]
MSDLSIDTTRVSEKGQIVIPKEVRDKLGLKAGSKLIIIATSDLMIMQRAELVGERMRAWEIVNRARSLAEKLGLRKLGL